MKDDKNIIILALLLGLGLWFLTRAKAFNGGDTELPPPNGEVTAQVEEPPQILHLNRLTPQKNYDNEEVREITYNKDGLPTRIVIHRHASAA
jgi:hypothetical protein